MFTYRLCNKEDLSCWTADMKFYVKYFEDK